MNNNIEKISELEIKQIIRTAEEWCDCRASIWIDHCDDISHYDYHIRAILWDARSKELFAVGYIAVQYPSKDEFILEDDWFSITFDEDPINYEIAIHGEMDVTTEPSYWTVLYRSKNKPSWLNECSDLLI